LTEHLTRLETLLRAYCDRYLGELRALEDLDDPDVIHDFRVATRRLTEVLNLVQRIEPRQASAALLSELGQAARTLSRLRERDVSLELLDGLGRTLPRHEYLVRWGCGALAPRLQKLRGRAADRARAALTWERRRELEQAVSALRAVRFDVSWDRVVVERDRLIARNRERVEALFPALRVSSPSVRDLHRLRIAFKALRYARELEQGGGAKRRTRVLRRFQNGLGAHRDWLELARAARVRRDRLGARGGRGNLVAGLEALVDHAEYRAEEALAATRRLAERVDPESL